MKQNSFPRTIALCVTGSLLAGSLVAGPNDSSSPGRPGSSPPQSPSPALPPSPASRMGPERLSQLMNATVKDQQGDAVGQISDFVIYPNSGRIQFAIISLGDQGGKLTAVPWAFIRAGSEPNTCTLNTTKDKLAGSRTFDAANWPDFSQPSTSRQIYSYYGIQPGRPGVGGRGNESSSSAGRPQQGNPGTPGTQNPPRPETPNVPPQ